VNARTTVAPSDYRQAMALAVNGVCVVTTDGRAGRFGITISSLASVSADPALVLVCVRRGIPVHRALTENGVFCVNLLGTIHRELAEAFAGRSSRGRAYQFAAGAWTTGTTPAPRLTGAVAAFDCALEQAHDAGTHTVFIGRVAAVICAGGSPLLYTGRAYGSVARLTPPAPERQSMQPRVA
jgi:flavin reductase